MWDHPKRLSCPYLLIGGDPRKRGGRWLCWLWNRVGGGASRQVGDSGWRGNPTWVVKQARRNQDNGESRRGRRALEKKGNHKEFTESNSQWKYWSRPNYQSMWDNLSKTGCSCSSYKGVLMRTDEEQVWWQEQSRLRTRLPENLLSPPKTQKPKHNSQAWQDSSKKDPNIGSETGSRLMNNKQTLLIWTKPRAQQRQDVQKQFKTLNQWIKKQTIVWH